MLMQDVMVTDVYICTLRYVCICSEKILLKKLGNSIHSVFYRTLEKSEVGSVATYIEKLCKRAKSLIMGRNDN